MSGEIGVIGYGAVGAATVERLAAAGRPVVVAQRQAPANLPPGVDFRRCDALDADSVRAAVAGLSQVVLAIGFPYVGALWREAWPRDDDEFRRGLRGRRRAPRLLRQPLHVRPADRAAQRNDAAATVRRQAGGAGRGDAHLDGGERGGTAARRRAARARLLRARRAAQPISATPPSARSRAAAAPRSSARPTRRTTSPMCRIARAPSSACSTRPTTPTARPGTSPARRPARRAKSWRSARRRSASRRRRSACRRRCSARSACSSRRCANSPRCGSSGIAPTASDSSRFAAALLGRRDAVRGRRAGDRAVVPRPRRRALDARRVISPASDRTKASAASISLARKASSPKRPAPPHPAAHASGRA